MSRFRKTIPVALVTAAIAVSWLVRPTSAAGQASVGEPAGDGRPLVVSTASIFADMAAAIGGDLIESRSIVPLGGDPHSYEPTPESAALVAEADLVLRNGLTFEGWLTELIRYSSGGAPVTLITKGIEPLGSLDYAGSEDPHAWMDASLGVVYADNIYRALAATFPEYAEEFAFNFGVYRGQLLDLDRWIRDTIATIPPDDRVLITSHDAFQYYGRAYNLRLESILGTSTDADAQTSDVARVVALIEEAGVPAVFVESTVNPKLLRQIADDTGARIGGSLYADSLGEPEGPAGTYIGMLEHNTRTIVRGLTASADTPTSADDGFGEEEGSIPLLVSVLGAVFAAGFAIMFRYAQA